MCCSSFHGGTFRGVVYLAQVNLRQAHNPPKERRLLDLMTIFALVAVVLTVSGLASGVVERAPLSFPIVFLGLGFLLGGRGLGVIDVGPGDAALEAVAFLVLALALF